jgi:hypothetical protein
VAGIHHQTFADWVRWPHSIQHGNSITWAYNGSWPNPDTFNAGEAYQIKRVLSALDQNERGNGDLIITTNGIPQNPRWTHQALEPCM